MPETAIRRIGLTLRTLTERRQLPLVHPTRSHPVRIHALIGVTKYRTTSGVGVLKFHHQFVRALRQKTGSRALSIPMCLPLTPERVCISDGNDFRAPVVVEARGGVFGWIVPSRTRYRTGGQNAPTFRDARRVAITPADAVPNLLGRSIVLRHSHPPGWRCRLSPPPDRP
jgi:hypothetical protein